LYQIKTLMNKKTGIRDLMKSKRYGAIHLKEALIERNVPGNWEAYQNVYNLMSGRTPRDSYAFIVIADMLGEDLRDILMRYSTVQDEVMNYTNKELEQDFNW